MGLRKLPKRLFGRAFTAFVAMAFSVATLIVSAGTASADPAVDHGNGGRGYYLALGDSVAFGYRPPSATPLPNYQDPASFVSYANYVAQRLALHLVNASCPGETTASMIDPKAISNGCENTLGETGGYRTYFPLHVSYTGSQLAFAVHFLEEHPNTRLVTIDVGADDAFFCQETTKGSCASAKELGGVLNTIATNLAKIYHAIRVEAGFEGPIVALTYYSLSYASSAAGLQQVALTNALNTAIDAPNLTFDVTVANGFEAFRWASLAHGGDPCAAGLLVRVPVSDSSAGLVGCNIHPSLKGHHVLADAIVQALLGRGYEGMVTSMGRAA